jgi:hypothetical protein
MSGVAERRSRKAGQSGQPQEYMNTYSILRIGRFGPTQDLGPRGGFEMASKAFAKNTFTSILSSISHAMADNSRQTLL